MKLKSLFIVLLLAISINAEVVKNGDKMNITTKSSYSTYANIHLASSNSKKSDVVFILLHGKSSKPEKSHYENLISKLNDEGFSVIAPKMTWSKKWTGTFNQGLEVVDEIAKSIVDDGRKVVLIGHSLGGASSLIYAADSNRELVSAVVTIAPGHMIHSSKKMRKVTKKSVEKARKKVSQGSGDEEFTFVEQNTGKKKDVTMKAKVYQSFYDPEVFPNVKDLLEYVEVPVLWIAGKEDRLTNIYRMEELFEWLGDNDKNSYKLLEGKHKSVLNNSHKEIASWANEL